MFTANKLFQNSLLQLKWKISKHQPKIMSLLIVNMMLVLVGGVTSGRTFSYIGSTEVQLVHYSILGFLFIECLLMFIYGSIINAPAEWKVISYLPMTRTSALLSNIVFLFLLSVLTAVLTYCNVYITAVFQSITYDGTWLFDVNGSFSFMSWIVLIFLYWMVCSAGYLLGSIGEVSKMLLFITLALVFWLVFRQSLLPIVLEWLIAGGNTIFTAKCIGITFVAFLASYLLTRHQEVKV